MKPELIVPTATRVSTMAYSANRQWFPYALALATLLGLAAVPPSAKGQTLTTLHSFEYVDGTATGPLTGVIRDAAGNLYGTTTGGGDVSCYEPAGCGTVFKLDRTGEKTVLHSFTRGADGARPFAGLIRDTAGNLYGTTGEGGTFNFGTVFKVDATGAETVLHSFNWVDGLGPAAGVIRDAIGNLYGTTEYGGASLNGTVFKLDINGTETVLYTFSGGADGESPNAVIRDKAGNFYGTTYSGGRQDNGTIFKVDKTGKKTTLYTFTRPPSTRNVDGVTPNSGLVLYKGALYGTTVGGGAFGWGTVFKIDQSKRETLLYSFKGGPDGSTPQGGLVRDAAGNLYGATGYGGEWNKGTVYKVDPRGNETVLYSFTGADGDTPSGGLIRDAAGNLYGTTMFGGVYGGGTVFKLAP